MSDIIDEVKKQLRKMYPEILIRWTKPGDGLWFESPGIALRLDWRYKGYEGGCVITNLLASYPQEAVWTFVAKVKREIEKIERKIAQT